MVQPVQVLGATGISYRLHIVIDLVKLELRQVEVSTDKVGESLAYYDLGNGDVTIIDRGYNQLKSLVLFGRTMGRYNPHGMTLYHQNKAITKVDWGDGLEKLNGEAGIFSVY